MRAIDADKLLDDIEDAIDIENDGQDIKKSNLIILGLKIAKKYIKKAHTIEVEPDKCWISIKDRLPENDGLYIVCKTVRGHQISFEAHWKGNKWLSVVKNNQLDYVTHWQPLPSTEGLNEA